MKNKLFFTATLVLLVLPLLTSGQAQATPSQLKYRAIFSCLASGECVIFPEFDFFSQPPMTPEALYIGKGTMSLCGSGEVAQVQSDSFIHYTYYTTESGIKALGTLSAGWNDQSMSLLLLSQSETSGTFVDESAMTDTFLTGLYPYPGQTVNPTLSYNGIYRSSTGIKAISGKAVVIAGTIESSTLIAALIYKPDGSPLVTIFWVRQDTTISPSPPFTVHAADVFKHYVKITLSR